MDILRNLHSCRNLRSFHIHRGIRHNILHGSSRQNHQNVSNAFCILPTGEAQRERRQRRRLEQRISSETNADKDFLIIFFYISTVIPRYIGKRKFLKTDIEDMGQNIRKLLA